MKIQPASLAFLIGLAMVAPAVVFPAQAPASQKKGSDAKKKAAQQATLSGCLDQQDGRYVLVDDRGLSPVADLEAEGFPTEGFAKYMGHKVTLRGISNSGSTRPVFKVRSIETVSETCVPAAQSDKK